MSEYPSYSHIQEPGLNSWLGLLTRHYSYQRSWSLIYSFFSFRKFSCHKGRLKSNTMSTKTFLLTLLPLTVLLGHFTPQYHVTPTDFWLVCQGEMHHAGSDSPREASLPQLHTSGQARVRLEMHSQQAQAHRALQSLKFLPLASFGSSSRHLVIRHE